MSDEKYKSIHFRASMLAFISLILNNHFLKIDSVYVGILVLYTLFLLIVWRRWKKSKSV